MTEAERQETFNIVFDEELEKLKTEEILRFVNSVAKFGRITILNVKEKSTIETLWGGTENMKYVVIEFLSNGKKYKYFDYRAFDGCCSHVHLFEVE